MTERVANTLNAKLRTTYTTTASRKRHSDSPATHLPYGMCQQPMYDRSTSERRGSNGRRTDEAKKRVENSLQKLALIRCRKHPNHAPEAASSRLCVKLTIHVNEAYHGDDLFSSSMFARGTRDSGRVV